MFVEPGDDAVEQVDPVFFLSDTVPFPGIDDEFRFHTVPSQPPVKLLALSDGVGGIVLSAQ